MSRIIIRNLFITGGSCRRSLFRRSFRNVSSIQERHYSDKRDPFKGEITDTESFLSIQNKTKETYLDMIEIFKRRDRLRQGHVEFIYSALKHMKEFGVEKDLEVYKQLIDVFPKGKMIPKNIFQAEFMHYPKHQQCAIDLLEQMEENGVMPDWEMQDQLLNVFGSRGYPLRRYWRMMYWMPKFRKASPWPLPQQLTTDPLELAKLAIARITDVDPTTEVTVHQTKEVVGSVDETWLVSGQSECQRDLISQLPAEGQTLYVDGGQRVWLRDKAVSYFTLSTAPFRKFSDDYDVDDVSNLLEKRLSPKRTVHEIDEKVILGVGSSGSSSPDSMLSWIRILTLRSPRLAHLQVLFRLPGSPGEGPAPGISPPQEKIDSI